MLSLRHYMSWVLIIVTLICPYVYEEIDCFRARTEILWENFFRTGLISKYTQKWVVLYIIYRNLLALRKRRRYHFQYTVTKATQNEALLWKIAVLGREKVSFWCRNFLSLSLSGILWFYILPCRKSLPASGPSAVLLQEDSVKASK